MGSMHKTSRKVSSALHLRRRLRRVGGWICHHNHDESAAGPFSIDNASGLVRIRVKRGFNLVVRDTVTDSSDPYIVVTMGDQKLKSRVVKKNCNPEWNDELTLCVTDPDLPISLVSSIQSHIDQLDFPHRLISGESCFQTVYDKDTLTGDDKMGNAEIDLKPYLQCLEDEDLDLEKLPSPTTLLRVQPHRSNCLVDESCIVWENGKIVQDMLLRLRNVPQGQILLQIELVQFPQTHT